MQREEARVVVNLGEQPYAFDLLEGEDLRLVSRAGVGPSGQRMELPPMSLAVLMSSTEQAEDRAVQTH
jgi:maltooligosyltrehalose trehalohydrolase